jgi:hypothetical protein
LLIICSTMFVHAVQKSVACIELGGENWEEGGVKAILLTASCCQKSLKNVNRSAFLVKRHLTPSRTDVIFLQVIHA